MCSDCCWTSASTVHCWIASQSINCTKLYRSDGRSVLSLLPMANLLLLFVLWSLDGRKTGKILVNEQRFEYWEWKFNLIQCSTKLSVFGRVIVFLNRSLRSLSDCSMKIYVIAGWQHNCEAKERKKNLTELPLSARFPFHCHCDGCARVFSLWSWMIQTTHCQCLKFNNKSLGFMTHKPIVWSYIFYFSCRCFGDSSLENRKAEKKHAKCCFWKVNRQNKERNAGMAHSD